MKYYGNGIIKSEKDKREPLFRSCWKCNPAHEHLKNVDTLHVCFNCGEYWIFDKFLSDFYDHDENGELINEKEGDAKLHKFLIAKGIQVSEND